MNSWRIPFNRASLAGPELELMKEAVQAGHISGDGPFTRLCETFLERGFGVPRALLTASCTHSLELAALLLEVGPGDEIIVPSFTFVSTAGAFALRGPKIVFADIRPDTLNIDESHLRELATPRTRAIVPVHYAGVACEMDSILGLAEKEGIDVVEDNAHGFCGSYKGRPLGTFGRLATQSFHETKNFTCGEGGALLINDAGLVDRAEVLREKGTDRKRFFRGEVDKYTWEDLGSSYVLSDLLAAFLWAQLQATDAIQEARERIWHRYESGLSAWATESGVTLPHVPPHCKQAYHMFYVVMPSLSARSALIEHLKTRGILAVFHYLPLHLSKMGRLYGGRAGQCPIAEGISERLLRLPFYNSLTDDEQDEVIEAITVFSPSDRSEKRTSKIAFADAGHGASRRTKRTL